MSNGIRIFAGLSFVIALILLVGSPVVAATFQLSGQVTDPAGSPLAGATVEVIDLVTATTVTSATTEANGIYALSVEEGAYEIRVTLPPESGFKPITQQQTIVSETELNFVVVPLASGVTVSGQVTDRFGAGVENINLVVGGRGGTTDASGNYSITGVPVGTIPLQLYTSQTTSSGTLPGFSSMGAASDLTISGDTTLDIQIPSHRVEVYVQDPDGNPLSNAFVRSQHNFALTVPLLTTFGPLTGNISENVSRYGAVTDASGKATLWVFSSPEGSKYEILVDSPDYSQGAYLHLPVITDTNVVVSLQSLSSSLKVDIGGPYTVEEGNSIEVTATGSDPENGSLTYAWDLDNNGDYEAPGPTAIFSAVGLDGPSTQPIGVQVTNSAGLSATNYTTVEIKNVAPSVDAGPDAMIFSGETFEVNASFTDPRILDTHTATINFGTGEGPEPAILNQGAGAGIVTGSRQYATPNSYTVEVCVTDDDGGTGCDSLTLEVTPSEVVDKVLCDGETFSGFSDTLFTLDSAEDQDPGIRKIIRNCTFINGTDKAISIKKAKNVLIENNVFDTNFPEGQTDLHAITINCNMAGDVECSQPGVLDNLTIRGNTFKYISGDGLQIGAHNRFISNVFIENNTFIGGPEQGENGVDVKATLGPIYIRNNTFTGFRPCSLTCSGSPSGPGLNIGGNQVGLPTNIVVEGNDIYDNTTGIKLDLVSNVTIRNNNIHDNLQRGLKDYAGGSGLIIVDNQFSNNGEMQVEILPGMSDCTQSGNNFSGSGLIRWGPCE